MDIESANVKEQGCDFASMKPMEVCHQVWVGLEIFSGGGSLFEFNEIYVNAIRALRGPAVPRGLGQWEHGELPGLAGQGLTQRPVPPPQPGRAQLGSRGTSLGMETGWELGLRLGPALGSHGQAGLGSVELEPGLGGAGTDCPRADVGGLGWWGIACNMQCCYSNWI